MQMYLLAAGNEEIFVGRAALSHCQLDGQSCGTFYCERCHGANLVGRACHCRDGFRQLSELSGQFKPLNHSTRREVHSAKHPLKRLIQQKHHLQGIDSAKHHLRVSGILVPHILSQVVSNTENG
jgi:hypothetical protein